MKKNFKKLFIVSLMAAFSSVAFVATGCNAKDKINQLRCDHEFVNGEVTKDPTCTKPGERELVCEKCDYVQTEAIEATGHDWTLSIVMKEASCSEEGLGFYECNKCDASKDAIIEKTKHTIIGVPGFSATCETSGLSDGKKCGVCDTILEAQVVIPALGHTIEKNAGFAATCTDVGSTASEKCITCNTVFVEAVTLDALGHDIVSSGEIAPTCTDVGFTAGTYCQREGCTFKEAGHEIVDALGHNFVGVDCSRCDDKQNVTLSTFIDAGTNYSSVYSLIKVNAGENVTGGYYAITGTGSVTIAGETFTFASSKYETVPAASGFEIAYANGKTYLHFFADAEDNYKFIEAINGVEIQRMIVKHVSCEKTPYEVYLEAVTCTKEGTLSYRCKYCFFDMESRTVDAGPHNLMFDHYDPAPTCFAEGVEIQTCTICSEHFTEVAERIPHEYLKGYCTMCADRQYYVDGYDTEYSVTWDDSLNVACMQMWVGADLDLAHGISNYRYLSAGAMIMPLESYKAIGGGEGDMDYKAAADAKKYAYKLYTVRFNMNSGSFQEHFTSLIEIPIMYDQVNTEYVCIPYVVSEEFGVPVWRYSHTDYDKQARSAAYLAVEKMNEAALENYLVDGRYNAGMIKIIEQSAHLAMGFKTMCAADANCCVYWGTTLDTYTNNIVSNGVYNTSVNINVAHSYKNSYPNSDKGAVYNVRIPMLLKASDTSIKFHSEYEADSKYNFSYGIFDNYADDNYEINFVAGQKGAKKISLYDWSYDWYSMKFKDKHVINYIDWNFTVV